MKVFRVYKRTMGSGWFWMRREGEDWMVAYINACWGVSVDGHYVRWDNFDEFAGPLFPPEPELAKAKVLEFDSAAHEQEAKS